MQYKAIEDLLVTKLTTDLPTTVKVQAFPDDWANSGRLFVKTLVLVGLNRDELTPPTNSFACTLQQNGTLTFEINVLAKDLRTHQGIYPILEAIVASLNGYKPVANFGSCYFTSLGFQSYNAEAYWIWSIQLQLEYKLSTACAC